jgi:hypothetical protein
LPNTACNTQKNLIQTEKTQKISPFLCSSQKPFSISNIKIKSTFITIEQHAKPKLYREQNAKQNHKNKHYMKKKKKKGTNHWHYNMITPTSK